MQESNYPQLGQSHPVLTDNSRHYFPHKDQTKVEPSGCSPVKPACVSYLQRGAAIWEGRSGPLGVQAVAHLIWLQQDGAGINQGQSSGVKRSSMQGQRGLFEPGRVDGFFCLFLNESNPWDWMGNEISAPEILAFLIMFIINSRTLIISLHSFCLINKWCACTFGLVYGRGRERERERERGRDAESNTVLQARGDESDTNSKVVIIIFDQATSSTIWSQVGTNN